MTLSVLNSDFQSSLSLFWGPPDTILDSHDKYVSYSSKISSSKWVLHSKRCSQKSYGWYKLCKFVDIDHEKCRYSGIDFFLGYWKYHTCGIRICNIANVISYAWYFNGIFMRHKKSINTKPCDIFLYPSARHRNSEQWGGKMVLIIKTIRFL